MRAGTVSLLLSILSSEDSPVTPDRICSVSVCLGNDTEIHTQLQLPEGFEFESITQKKMDVDIWRKKKSG